MTTNLINQLLGEFKGDALNSVASALGESPSKTQSALTAVVPALMGGLANKGSTLAGADSILDFIRQNKLDTNRFGDTATAVKGPTGVSSLMDAGRPLVDSIFGNRTSSIADWASSFAGVSRPSATSLLGLAVPLLLGHISRQLKANGWSAANLMSLLAGQRSFLQEGPPGLAGVLSGEEALHGARTVGSYEREPHRTYHAQHHRTSPWLWVVPLLLLIPLLAYFFARRDEPVRQVTVQRTIPRAEVPKAVGTTSVPTVTLGPFVEHKLPNNVIIRIPSNGVESRMLAYLEDKSRSAGTGTWFSFDRLEFDTDSSRLTAGSSEQIRNVAMILKAYPNARVEIGGFTDNVADSAYNLRLSQERASAAMNAISNFGVDRLRMDAKGYGETNPVADNSTAEGRQHNRRVDIRVTQK